MSRVKSYSIDDVTTINVTTINAPMKRFVKEQLLADQMLF